MATWLQRAFNKTGLDDPFLIALAKGITQPARTLGASALLPAYELSNQLNRVTDGNPETKWNYNPLGNQSFGGALGRNALSGLTGGGSSIVSALLNQLGAENRLAPQYNWTPEARQMATQNSLLDTQERQGFVESPENATNRMVGQVGVGLASAGLAPAIKAMSFVPRAASRFALGFPQGVLGADKTKGQNPLLGGLFAGTTSVGAGELGDLLSGQNIDYSKLKNIEDINKLPKRQKSLLFRQAKTSGFYNSDLSDEKNILTFLNNRDLAGKIPQESLYNIESEIGKQKGNRKGSLKKMPGLSSNVVDPVKDDVLSRLSKESGMSQDIVRGTSAWREISSWLDEGNFDADSIDKAVASWQKNARTLSGNVKSNNDSAVYQTFAASLKDALRGKSPVSGKIAQKIPAIGNFDESVSSLDKLFGFQDEFSKSITRASAKSGKASIPFPGMLGGPRIPVSKIGQGLMRANSTRANVAEKGLSSGPASQFLGNIASMGGARFADAISPALGVPSQLDQGSGLQGQTPEGLGQGGATQQEVSQGDSFDLGSLPGWGSLDTLGQSASQSGPQQTQQYDMQRLQQDLMGAVLAGQISPTEAQYVLQSMQGLGGGSSITAQINQLAQTDPQQASALLGQAVLSGQIDPTTAKAYTDLLGLDQNSSEMSARSENAMVAYGDLQSIKKLLANGANAVPLATILPANGLSPTAQTYENAVRNITDVIARSRTGAAMNLKEEELYRQFAPRVTDTRASREDKLARLEKMFRLVMEGDGIDVDALQTPSETPSIVQDYNYGQ